MPRKNKGMWYEVHPTPAKGQTLSVCMKPTTISVCWGLGTVL